MATPTHTVTLRRIGDEVSVPLPADVLAQSGLGDGSAVVVSVSASGVLLVPAAELPSDLKEAFESVSERYANALSELAT